MMDYKECARIAGEECKKAQAELITLKRDVAFVGDELDRYRAIVCEKDEEIAALKDKHVCVWIVSREFETDVWETGCDNAYEFTNDGPKENRMKFCPYCGGALIVEGRTE